MPHDTGAPPSSILLCKLNNNTNIFLGQTQHKQRMKQRGRVPPAKTCPSNYHTKQFSALIPGGSILWRILNWIKKTKPRGFPVTAGSVLWTQLWVRTGQVWTRDYYGWPRRGEDSPLTFSYAVETWDYSNVRQCLVIIRGDHRPGLYRQMDLESGAGCPVTVAETVLPRAFRVFLPWSVLVSTRALLVWPHGRGQSRIWGENTMDDTEDYVRMSGLTALNGALRNCSKQRMRMRRVAQQRSCQFSCGTHTLCTRLCRAIAHPVRLHRLTCLGPGQTLMVLRLISLPKQAQNMYPGSGLLMEEID
ncbi:hypothetical protein RRG08_049462 [Elysia crispata]|uniref:Uncharacterized protein n=1 Tax=Elysia crispata TaxID=231223 RepID=A0AAE1DL03_9GAST|nr:hypothetical protein RRG08_049462 [Elysia crispata]